MQAAHALLEASRQGLISPEIEHPHLVLCQVDIILPEVQRLHAAGVRSIYYSEPDMDNLPTALATEPVYGERRRVLRHYRLLKEDSHA